MSMEFLYPSFFNTTTQAVVDSNTSTVANLFNRDVRYQYASSGYANDLTSTTIRISFDTTQTVSRIALIEHNLKAFTVYYNGVTANTFALTTTGDTTLSDYATNSNTACYLRATPTFCTSVSFQLKSTIVANAEKAIGYLLIGNTKHTFTRNPPAKGFKCKLDPQDIVHRLSDGGTRIQNVSDKFSASLSYKHIDATERASLKAVYESHQEMVFVPFGTTTAWDEILFACVWAGNFDFFEYSDEAPGAGFQGKIELLEVPK